MKLKRPDINLRSLGRIVSFLKTYIPGYENCRLKSSGSTLGVRETRRIIGDQTVTDHDVGNVKGDLPHPAELIDRSINRVML